MLESIKKINDGFQGILDPINGFVSNLDKHRTKEGITLLVQYGFNAEDIQQLIDVSRTQADPFIEETILRFNIEKQVREQIAAEEAAKPKRKPRAA